MYNTRKRERDKEKNIFAVSIRTGFTGLSPRYFLAWNAKRNAASLFWLNTVFYKGIRLFLHKTIKLPSKHSKSS